MHVLIFLIGFLYEKVEFKSETGHIVRGERGEGRGERGEGEKGGGEGLPMHCCLVLSNRCLRASDFAIVSRQLCHSFSATDN